MGKIIIYTAIFGDHDILKTQPKQTVDCEFVCFTDNPKLYCENGANKQWKIILCKKQYWHPRMNAKRYRTHPSEIFDEYDCVVYVDWSAKLKSKHSLEILLEQFKIWTEILCFKHPDRDCIFKEAEFTANANMKKYKWLEKTMLEQVEEYKKNGMPKEYWLSATWLIVSTNTEKAKKFFHDRREECRKRTYQDQLSFEYLIRKNRIQRSHIKWKESEYLWENNVVDFLYPHLKST